MKRGTNFRVKKLLLSILTNPIFLVAYFISFYELYTLCQFGRFNNNILILGLCLLILFLVVIYSIIRFILKRNAFIKVNNKYKSIWNVIAIVIIIISTLFYGYKIVYSAIPYNGKLSWYLQDLKNKRTVEFQHNNIYEDGIEGIFSDINEKIDLPEELYVSTSFSLNFNVNGTITSFDTFLYGKDEEGELKTFLITYDNSKSKEITLYLNGEANADFNEDKLLKPLRDTMNIISLEDTLSNWNEENYGILYYGKRSFGFNSDGIVYINKNGETKAPDLLSHEIVGYTVSVYVPEKEDEYTPVRYILVDNLDNIKENSSSNNTEESTENTKESEDISKPYDAKFDLSEEVKYRLVVEDAAAGTRFYSLYGTFDGGNTWGVINEDPFLGNGGGAYGITFINSNLGFISLSKSGGSYGELYRTEDGGKSYEKVEYPKEEVGSLNGESYAPFDFPNMPYEEDGKLKMLVGQGSDGDYNGNSSGLYESNDKGKTWTYIKEWKE